MKETVRNVTVVTGAARGIGREIALSCARRGDAVFALDVIASGDVASYEENIQYLRCDVTDRDQVASCVATIIEEHGAITTWVNNAGITRDGMALRMKEDAWRVVLDVNLTGTFYGCQAVLPHMARQRAGSIINMSSVVGSVGNPGQANYAASKAGVDALTKTLAKEYGSRGIRVNAVAPGFITTEMTRRLPEASVQAAIAQTSLKRAGTCDDVANLVLFLSSDESSYITGQIIHINGGMW